MTTNSSVLVDERLDLAPCGFLTFNEDGTLLWANQTLLQMLGYQREELVNQPVERIFTIGSRIFYQTHWFPLLRMAGRAEEIFLMLRTQSGEEIGALVNAVQREDSEGVRYDCVVMQVRERRKYEDELLRARKAAEEARAELQEQKEALEHANETLESQALELELQQQALEEQAVELEATGEEIRAVNHDLRVRTEEAEQLRIIADEANQAKSAFLAMMSHELRTPLNAIAGYLQILEMGIHGPVTEAQLETLGRINRSQRHLLRLINEILNLARIEAGQVQYSMEEVRIEDIVASVSPMVEPQFQMKEIAFEASAPPGVAVRADRDKLEQVLLNLLSNAAKFTGSRGRVQIITELTEDERQVLVKVSDTGMGIPPDKLDNIFDPFVQVDTSRTRSDEGSGLGLAISRDLARGMGGELELESELGKGSTFTIRLDRA